MISHSLSKPGNIICLLFFFFALSSLSSAERTVDSSPVVPGYERVYNAPILDADEEDEEDPEEITPRDRTHSGRVLLGELGCVKCHQATEETTAQLLLKQAPVLTDVGNRVRPEFLSDFLKNPQATKPGTTMPNLFAEVSEQQTKNEVAALVQFLASTGEGPLAVFPSPTLVKRGEKLFHEVGCAACHGSPEGQGKNLTTSVPLGPLDQKYTITSLAQYIQNPLHVRPSGRMPSLNLQDKEARSIASYLLKNVEGVANVKFDYYEGSFGKLPDFDSIKPVESGQTVEIGVDLALKKDDFAFRFHSHFRVPQEGEYQFYLGSDDGSKLWINDELLIDYDGVHGYDQKKATLKLTPGWHTFQLGYFERGGDEKLTIEIEGPGLSRTDLANISSVDPNAQQEEASFTLDSDLVNLGKQVFLKRGCANCHELKQNGQPLLAAFSAKPLTALNLASGCLSPSTETGSPDYQLDDQQISDLQQTLKQIQTKKFEPLSGEKLVTHTLTSFNCYACHARGEIGGPELSRDQWFKSTIPEMGDEGRRPPALTGVGDKLQTSWLKQVLDSGSDERPYMHTRMPKFGLHNVGGLVDQFITLDRKAEIKPPDTQVADYRLQSEGRKFVGEKAMACIKCHTFGNHKATGIQSVDMLRLTQRVRRDWFQRYLVNPQTYRRGTRMPAFFYKNTTPYPDILEGDVTLQNEALWQFLSLGDKAPIPEGLGQSMIELKAETEPIIYRNFIEGLSPRGIAVGYPAGANLAFDAETMSLGLIWHGRFIDASRHWTGRGQGFQPPLGDHVISLVRGAPLAELKTEQTPWPTDSPMRQGYRFRGYQFDKNRQPIFLCSTEDYQVSDHLIPVEAEPDSHFQRVLTVTFNDDHKPADKLYYRVAAARKIEALDEARYQLDGALIVHLKNAATKPILRTSADQQELLLPLKAEQKIIKIELLYEW